jgi:hypothetical protein
VTRISAALKTAPDASCSSSALRVMAGSNGQDVVLTASQALQDTGAMSLPVSAGTNLQVQVQRPAACTQTNPADANVLVEYRAQQSGDAQICAQSGLACNGICEETQTDVNNCGGCGATCATGQFCHSGSCSTGQSCSSPASCTPPANGTATCNGGICGFTCNSGFTSCNGTCVNLQSDVNNCGACGNACPGGFGAPVCNAGACGLSGCPINDPTCNPIA